MFSVWRVIHIQHFSWSFQDTSLLRKANTANISREGLACSFLKRSLKRRRGEAKDRLRKHWLIHLTKLTRSLKATSWKALQKRIKVKKQPERQSSVKHTFTRISDSQELRLMFLAADNVWVTLTLLKVTEVFSFVKGSISAAGSFRSWGPFLKQKMVIEPSFVSYDNIWQTRTGRDEWRLSMTHYNRTGISKSTILRLRKNWTFPTL